MDHYIDVRLLPDADFAAPVLLNAMYAKLHRVLVAQAHTDIGVSFPGYVGKSPQGGDQEGPSLGLTLRLHGNLLALESLQSTRWLSGFADYAMIGGIHPIPAEVRYIRVARRQSKSSVGIERERLMRRKGIDEAEARRRIPDAVAKHLDLPFITLDSASTGQRFLLFIDQQVVDANATGTFNRYGLSSTATLPIW